MSLTYGMATTKVEPFGSFATIPNNAAAKLMYYLNCVAGLIDETQHIVIDYKKYRSLTDELLEELYKVALEINPNYLITNGIFIINPNLLINAGNQFYKITDERFGFHGNREIIILGNIVKVINVMVCNKEWLETYYFQPMDEIESEIRRKRNIPITVTTGFKSTPIAMTCPNCGNTITTITKSKFNFIACFCLFFFGMFYCCFQACTNRNLCCFDIVHICPICGRTLGYYKSC